MNQVNFDDWKAHPHYLGDLMTPAKGKSNQQQYDEAQTSYGEKFEEYSNLNSDQRKMKKGTDLLAAIKKLDEKISELEPIKHYPHLSVGCKTKLRKIWVATMTGRQFRVESKYLEKGLLVEEDVITAYSIYSKQFHKKNKVRRENEWLTGEWDFTTDDDTIIVDGKGSWELGTFYESYFKPLDSGYNWQLQGYMDLDKKKKAAKLVYALINTPQHLLDAELKFVMYKMFGNEGNMQLAPKEMLDAYEEECEYIRSHHIFDDLPLERKIKVFDVPRDEKMISQIHPKIEDCRWYLNNFEMMQEYERGED